VVGRGADARLRGMVEEVVWGNAIWYGIGGWASRGVCGRVTNADFFSYTFRSAACLPDRAKTELTVHPYSKRAPRHLNHLLPEDRPPGRIVIQQRARPLVRQSPPAALNVPLRVRGTVHHER